MNERIEELARQAGALPTQDCGVPQWYIDEDGLEKFAELLEKEFFSAGYIAGKSDGTLETVRECANIANDWYQNHNNIHWDPGQHIRNHFGVE